MINKELRKYLFNNLIKESHIMGDKLTDDKISKFELKKLFDKDYKHLLVRTPGVISGKKRVIDTRVSTKIIFEYFKYLYQDEFDRYNSLENILKEIVIQFPSVYKEDRVLACILYELTK